MWKQYPKQSVYDIHLHTKKTRYQKIHAAALSAYPGSATAAISAATRQIGGEDGCYREKFRNFVAWAEPDPKQHFFAFLGHPSGILRTAWRVPKSGHVTITKIENLHIGTRRKIHRFKVLFFSIYDEK